MNAAFPYQQLLMEMIAIPALSREEHQRADYLEQFLYQWGMPATRIKNNLLVGDPESKPGLPSILMNSHLDTVPPAEGWESDPFTASLENGRITGLGSNDAGASVVTMIAAFHGLRASMEKRMNLMLLITAEEEVSGPDGIVAVLPMLGHLDGVIVGEPTGMQPAVAERGLMVIDAEVRGIAGHAARNEGLNAIYLALKDIKSIESLHFPDPSEWLPDPGAQVTMINGGTKHNVVPDRCKYVVDVRSNDRYGNEKILDMLKERCKANLIPRSTRLQSSHLRRNHFLMDAVTSLGLKPFGSPTISDMALIPFPSIKMGPGESARSHAAEEYVEINELAHGVTFYQKLLEALEGAWRKQANHHLKIN